MKIHQISKYNVSFGFRSFIKKTNIARDVISSATKTEQKQLCRALGLTTKNLSNWQPKIKLYGEDIIEGECLPNITVCSKGVSLTQVIGNVVNVELARIRGQLKKVSIENLSL